jgi:uncharacterized membrane protein
MNRQQFIAKLKGSLGRLDEAEKREIVAEYEEHFQAGTAEGRSEEDIARALGNPASLGASYRIENLTERGRSGWGVADTVRAVFASLSLGFFNVVIVLGPFVGLVAVVASLWATAAAIGLSGVACVLAAIIGPFLPGGLLAGVTAMSALFAGLSGVALVALGFLAVVGMVYVTKWFAILVARYVQFNARIITGRKQEG